MRDLYMNKANRDAEFNRLGGTKAGYKKTSIRNQMINPKYVADSGVTGPTGFGDDLESFSVLYGISKVLNYKPVMPKTHSVVEPAAPTYRGGFKKILNDPRDLSAPWVR